MAFTEWIGILSSDCSGHGHGPPAGLCDFGDGVSGISHRSLVAGPHSKGRSFTCTYVEGKPNINPHCECLGTSFPTSIVGFVSTCPVPLGGSGRVLLSRRKLLAYIHSSILIGCGFFFRYKM